MAECRTLWKYKHFVAKPIEVTGTAYPEKDSEGEQIFTNTHFASREACWECMEKNSAAGVSLAGSTVRSARATLLKAEKNAADEAMYFADVRLARAHEVPLCQR